MMNAYLEREMRFNISIKCCYLPCIAALNMGDKFQLTLLETRFIEYMKNERHSSYQCKQSASVFAQH